MSMRISICLSLGLSLGSLASGCAWVQASDIDVESKGPGRDSHLAGDVVTGDVTLALLPAGVLRDDLLMQQRITVQWADREERFDAVLQKSGQTLLLVGLGPMNTVGFSLSLDDRGVTFDNRSGREMPFRPERILADVQRIFYPWIEEGPPCLECERREIRAGLEVRERIGARFLEERSFRVVDRPDRGEIVVRYEGWTNGSLAPSRAILRNGWFGYQLIIDTTSAERID
jgi:hypothetical protein